MSDKPTYQALESQIAELKKQNKTLMNVNVGLEERLKKSKIAQSGLGDTGSVSEVAVKASEKKYRELFESLIDEVHIWELIKNENGETTGWKLSDVNPAALKVWKKTKEEVIGKTANEVFGYDAHADFMPIINQMATTKQAVRWIKYFKPTNQYLSMQSIPFGNHFISTGRDINDFEQTEGASREGLSLLRNIIDSSTDYIFVKDRELKTIMCNQTFAKAVGKEPSDLIGKTDIENGWDTGFVKGNPEKRIKGVEQDDLKVLSGETIHSTVTATIAGKVYFFDSVKSPLRNEKHEIFGLLGINRDITEQKQVEKVLKKSEERHRMFNDPSFGGSVIHDKGLIRDCSNGLSNITGYTRSELIGMDGLLLAAPEWRGFVRDKIASGFRDPYEAEGIRKDGSTFPVRIHAKPIQYQGKEVRVAEFRDITELKKTEQLLKESNAAKDKLFSIIGHDLRSPFNHITGLTELLLQYPASFSDSEAETYLGIVNSTAKNTLGVLDNLLNWARSETGQIYFNPEKQILSSIIEEVFTLLNSIAQKKEIVLNYSESEEIIVFADQNMIETILRNLIFNAIKYTNSDGQINVYASESNKHIEIAVSDTGVGMKEEVREKLFSSVANESTPGTANEKGTGIGLLLCKDFIEKHGGQLWVESEVGKGSTFTFTLPIP